MKKTLNIIKTIITWLLVVTAVAMLVFTVFSVTTFDRNDRDIFGYKAYIVRSDSMKSVDGDFEKGYFKAGDLIFVKEVDPETLNVGDIIAYTSTNPENIGETVTHMIKSKTVDENGEAGFITYGTSTGTEDTNVVTYPYVLGKYRSHIAGVGKFFAFLKTPTGYIICIVLPLLLLIIIQGISSVRLFKKHKQKQMAEIVAEYEAKETELLLNFEKDKAEMLTDFENEKIRLKSAFEKEKDELLTNFEREKAQLKAEIEREKISLQIQHETLETEHRRQEEMMQRLLDMQATLLNNIASQKEIGEVKNPNNSTWSNRLRSAVQIVIGKK